MNTFIMCLHVGINILTFFLNEFHAKKKNTFVVSILKKETKLLGYKDSFRH